MNLNFVRASLIKLPFEVEFYWIFFLSSTSLCLFRCVRLNWITFQRNNKTLLTPNRGHLFSMVHDKLVHIFEFQVELKHLSLARLLVRFASNCSHSILLAWHGLTSDLSLSQVIWARWCTCHNRIMFKVLSMSFSTTHAHITHQNQYSLFDIIDSRINRRSSSSSRSGESTIDRFGR